MYAFAPGKTLCLVDEDFYLAIGLTFYEFVNIRQLTIQYNFYHEDLEEHEEKILLATDLHR